MKLDLGCGPNKREGFTGVDRHQFGSVDVVHDLTTPWPWEDGSVDEVHCSHFVEHLDATERIHFVNELWRVLKVGGQAQIIAPHCLSERAYGDLTHKWPPISTFWFSYLSRDWRAINAPHNDFYRCHFAITWGYSLHPDTALRAQEHQLFAVQFYKEAIQDVIATFTKVE